MSLNGLIREKRISFGINAQWGLGGQGEFMRLMGLAIREIPQGECFGVWTYSQPGFVRTFKPTPSFFDKLIHKSPVFRYRIDWRVLRADMLFDRWLAEAVGTPDLFDGIAGQCCHTFNRLKEKGSSKLILTSLNTHPDFLRETLDAEYERLKIRTPHFIHPKMHRRMLEEIEMADHVRVNSHWAKRTFVDRGVAAEKVSVIHPGVEHKQFYSSPKKDDVFRVMAVATLEPRKGIVYLLKAFEEANILNSELVLIGYTSDRWSRKTLFDFMKRDNRIKVKSADIMSLPIEETLGTASVIVHPAIEDGFGLVIPQALASGRPVIATRQSGAAELISHGETGFIVESRSVEEIKKYLIALSTSTHLQESMKLRAAESTKQLTYKKFSDDVLELYHRVLGAA